MKTELGFLIHVKHAVDFPVLELLSAEVKREDAKTSALIAFSQSCWHGPRQVLFVRRDGLVELWDIELLNNETSNQNQR